MNFPIKRRHFATQLAGAALAYSLAPHLQAQTPSLDTTYRIELLPGETYPASFLKFAERARFDNITQALDSIKNPHLCYRLIPITPTENSTEPFQR